MGGVRGDSLKLKRWTTFHFLKLLCRRSRSCVLSRDPETSQKASEGCTSVKVLTSQFGSPNNSSGLNLTPLRGLFLLVAPPACCTEELLDVCRQPENQKTRVPCFPASHSEFLQSSCPAAVFCADAFLLSSGRKM